MIMTEEEARKKWCPHARVWVEGDENGAFAAGNRDCGPFDRDGNYTPKPHNAARCIASGCMAWRWLTWGNDDRIWKATGPNIAKTTNEHTGYCGLAGKP